MINLHLKSTFSGGKYRKDPRSIPYPLHENRSSAPK